MPDDNKPVAIEAASVSPTRTSHGYPEPCAARGRTREASTR